jgi:hypothetical protein
MVATVERLSLAIHTGEALCCVQLNWADSWLGISKRHGPASYTGPGGDASGGSVKNPCYKRRAVSRTPVDSGTSRNAFRRSKLGVSSHRDDLCFGSN